MMRKLKIIPLKIQLNKSDSKFSKINIVLLLQLHQPHLSLIKRPEMHLRARLAKLQFCDCTQLTPVALSNEF